MRPTRVLPRPIPIAVPLRQAIGAAHARRRTDPRFDLQFNHAIAEGLRSPGLQQRLDALDAERRQIDATLAAAAPSPVRLHPNLAELYRKKVAALHEALQDLHTQAEALEIVRSLIEQVVVRPAAGGGVEVELVGEIASMVDVAMAPERKNAAREGAALDERARRSVKVVAGTRNHRELTLRYPV